MLPGPSTTRDHTDAPAAARTADAVAAVLTFTITDAFALTVEESMWVAFHLHDMLEPFTHQDPYTTPLAVRTELRTRAFSRVLAAADLQGSNTVALPADPAVVAADAADWAAVLTDTVSTTYRMRPMRESAVFGTLMGLLRELGVGHPDNPRGARYLPVAVRHRLASKTVVPA